MGAVEAVSLSILVGSSIDYCIHLVEGYRVAGCQVKMDSGKVGFCYYYIVVILALKGNRNKCYKKCHCRKTGGF